jgi:hypothetical protein
MSCLKQLPVHYTNSGEDSTASRQTARGAIMMTKTRRKYSRYFDHVPILYAGFDSKSYDRAVMRNSCADGMYFESNSPIPLSGDLYIKIQDHRPVSDTTEQYKDFRARVKWSRQMTADKMPFYGIGVQFTAKSHLSYGINSTNSDCPCDFCENRSSSKLIHRTETGMQLCPDCLQHMETLPRSIEEAVERFLLGNVV